MKTIIVVLSTIFLASALTCQQGQVANSLNICIEPTYIQGCYTYLNENACKTCQYRYTLLPSGVCQIDKTANEECCKSRSSTGCAECMDGLYMINGRCQQSNILGCLEKDTRGVCINCASDFFLKDGLCYPSIKNCESYTDKAHTVCTVCQPNYSLINNLCVENTILGCKNEIDHICKECFSPFQLSNSHCEINNCKNYNEFGCTACQCGFYLSPDKICKTMDRGCIRYQRGSCTDCLPNYKLKGNVCQIQGCLKKDGVNCSSCEQGYKLVKGGCVLSNCISWNNGICDVCQEGFLLFKGRCQQSKNLNIK